MLGSMNVVTLGPRIVVDSVVISTRMDLVSKEVDFIVVLQKLQTVRFIHSFRENIEGGLTADQIHEMHVRKALLQIVNHRSTHMMFPVISLKGGLLLRRRVVSHRADVDHGGSEVDKQTSFDGQIQLTQVAKTAADERIELRVRIQVLYVNLVKQRVAPVRIGPILGKQILRLGYEVNSQLILMFCIGRASNKPDIDNIVQL